MAKRARIVFGDRDYPIDPDTVDSVVEGLLEVKPGGASVLRVSTEDEEDVLFWTPGTPIAFEIWDDEDH
ncbi:hypothetical protein [Microbacterium algeriense]|uniref:Uncharacterized protein n=1 Tax=Microbacterium algeriense TaxID=2615184 RepID=A0ABQ6VAA6_9MICO|nr:hypothetical protein [Microbacterium algeriense]KAB1867305.1 hypothetical protein F6A08_05830 [Microbacterium algeriense]